MRHHWIMSSLLLVSCASSGAETSGSMQTPLRGELNAALVQAELFGAELDLAQHLEEGQHVALVFWQSWCASCVKEAPAIQQASERYGEQIKFVGVISGPDSSVDELHLSETIDRLGLDYTQVRDRELNLTRLFDVQATPTLVVLDPNGDVAYRGHAPPQSWDALLGRS